MTNIIDTDSFVQIVDEESGDSMTGLRGYSAFKLMEMYVRFGLAEFGEVDTTDSDVVFVGASCICETRTPFAEFEVEVDGQHIHSTVSDEDGVISFTTEELPEGNVTVVSNDNTIVTSFDLITITSVSEDDVTDTIVNQLTESFSIKNEDVTIDVEEAKKMYYEDDTPELVKNHINNYICVDPVESSYMDFEQ